MAFDGITIANIRQELDKVITGGRIARIAQPEKDEILLTVKNNSRNIRVSLSANASLPLIRLVEENKPSPIQAPNFCMLLRKRLAGGKILRVTQPGLERIIRITVEHRNEMGDLTEASLITEIMGKHSNIILVDESDVIVDSIKKISFNVSSVREVLPGREYFIPDTQHKKDPLTVSKEDFLKILDQPLPVFKVLYQSLTGLSPQAAEEICFRAGIDGDLSGKGIRPEQADELHEVFSGLVRQIKDGDFHPFIYYKGKEPCAFSPLPLKTYQGYASKEYESVSALIGEFYDRKEAVTRIRQKSADLRHIVSTAMERTVKKLNLQKKQMKDTEKMDKYRVWGDLLNAYGYGLEEGAKVLETVNFYDGQPIQVPLDPSLTPSQNAKKYFDRYSKLKRTKEALTVQIADSEQEIEHLDSVATSLDLAIDEDDLAGIQKELTDTGYIRAKKDSAGRRTKISSKPLHYISSDGYDIYVGKNNYQNEEVSFKLASGSDWWFHAKKMPGSHVIVKGKGEELPDRTFEEAGSLAAWYSKGRQAPKVEIDYTQRKNLRKPAGAKPGFVVYYTNYSLMAVPDISKIREAD
ncbi:MAG: NFACT RNA binding domain-containing protein [Eubacterium sp.]|nr:NFACT RNA binding domain-containing protein [Eubacterium sp.]